MTGRLLAFVGAVLLGAPALVSGQVSTNSKITGVGSAASGTVQAGTGTATATVCGTLTTNTTQVGTDADLLEKDLWTYDLPANTLSADGKGIRITAWGSGAANANSKTIRGHWGATVVVLQGASINASGWRVVYEVVRTGASAQVGQGNLWANALTSINVPVAPAEDTSGAITIKVTGQNAVASANDIVFRGAIVECF